MVPLVACCVVRSNRLACQDALRTCKMRTCAQPHRRGATLTRLGCPLTSRVCTAQVEWGHGGACGTAGHQRPSRPRLAGTAPPHQPAIHDVHGAETARCWSTAGRVQRGGAGRVNTGTGSPPTNERGRAVVRVRDAGVWRASACRSDARRRRSPSHRGRRGRGVWRQRRARPPLPSARAALCCRRARSVWYQIAPLSRSTPDAARLRTAPPPDRPSPSTPRARAGGLLATTAAGGRPVSPPPAARQRRWCRRRRQRRR